MSVEKFTLYLEKRICLSLINKGQDEAVLSIYSYLVRILDRKTVPIGSPSSEKAFFYNEEQFLSNPELEYYRFLHHIGLSLPIYPKECRIRRVSKEDRVRFLGEYDSNAAIPGKLGYGYFYLNECIGLAVFSSIRSFRPAEGRKLRSIELIRLRTKPGMAIPNLVDSVVKQIIRDKNVDHIMTYSSVDSYDNLWIQAGFTWTACKRISVNTKEKSIKSHFQSNKFEYYRENIVYESATPKLILPLEEKL